MDLDGSLKELGQFGKFQAFYFTLLLFPVTLCGYRSLEYVFTTMDIPHRCRVPECESPSGPAQFSPPWLSQAVPFTEDHSPEVCLRYRPQHNNTRGDPSFCPADLFSPNITQPCSNWVFADPARTIGHDFNIMCPQDYWKRSLLGSLSVMASFLGIPLTGFVSDHVGRKTVLVYGSVVISVTGILRSFSPSYIVLAAFEVFDGLVMGSIYSPSFLLGILSDKVPVSTKDDFMSSIIKDGEYPGPSEPFCASLETLSPSKRLLGSMLVNMYFTVGEVMLALVMWLVQDWRVMQRVFYIPMLALVSLHWLLPESVRWLYTQGRYDDIEIIFRRIAKVNKTEMHLPNIISSLRASQQDKDGDCKGKVQPIRTLRLSAVLKSRIIVWRLFVCALCWIACIFAYYGVSQNATYFGGDRYVSFLLVSLVEVPAYVASLWVPDWALFGRRGSTAWSFFLSGAACFGLMFVTSEQKGLSLSLFLLAKFCSTLTITVIYLYTAEIFPTELRHSLLSICSMIGRFGSILSQQTMLISMFVNPMLVFGVVSVVGGALALTCPETLNTRLPDTIQEAEAITKTVRTAQRATDQADP